MPQKTIKENQPPDEIGEYIKIANFFPRCELKGLIRFVESVGSPETDNLASLTGSVFLKQLELDGYVDRWLETIKPFTDLYVELIKHPPHIEQLDTGNLVYRFQTFDHIQQVTNQVADIFEAQDKNRAIDQSLPWATWAVNGDGKLFITTSRIAEAFVGCEIARIKRCLNCKKIIWAYRLNRSYCNKKCSNDFHQKKLRQNPIRNKEINERRKNNREQIKSGAVKIIKRTKKNGTL